MREALHSPWGRLFHNWERVRPDAKGFPQVGEAQGGLVRSFGRVMVLAWRILVTCIKEAPEVARRKRRITSASRRVRVE